MTILFDKNLIDKLLISYHSFHTFNFYLSIAPVQASNVENE